MTEEERRALYRAPIEVREIAGLLQGQNPDEIDHWVDGNVHDLDEVRWLLSALLKYLVASGL